MIRLKIETSKPYEVLIGKGLLGSMADHVREAVGDARIALVADSTVSGLYSAKVIESLSEGGYDVTLIEFPAGEENKTLASYGQIMESLARAGLTRNDVIIALGGGVTGDMAGFAAATYLRGIRYIQVPTTYLACCDSSVGGKTAVDLGTGKNLCGAFWQPELVICDYDTFRTLSPSEFLDGSAEAFKSGMIGDPDLCEHVALAMGSLDTSAEIQEDISDEFGYVIEHSIDVKRNIVERDEHESGDRKLLNFGHTIGHAIEKVSGYAISHGHAVARGMAAETRAAVKLGLTENDLSSYVTESLSGMGFDLDIPFDLDKLVDAASHDKKVGSGTFTVIVPEEKGKASLKALPIDQMSDYIEQGISTL